MTWVPKTGTGQILLYVCQCISISRSVDDNWLLRSLWTASESPLILLLLLPTRRHFSTATIVTVVWCGWWCCWQWWCWWLHQQSLQSITLADKKWNITSCSRGDKEKQNVQRPICLSKLAECVAFSAEVMNLLVCYIKSNLDSLALTNYIKFKTFMIV